MTLKEAEMSRLLQLTYAIGFMWSVELSIANRKLHDLINRQMFGDHPILKYSLSKITRIGQGAIDR